MAAFRLKLTGLVGGPWGRIYTISDIATNRILASARAAYGQVPVDPAVPTGPKRDMTDKETTYKMLDGFIDGWLNNAFVNTKDVAKTAAVASITKDAATPADDNV